MSRLISWQAPNARLYLTGKVTDDDDDDCHKSVLLIKTLVACRILSYPRIICYFWLLLVEVPKISPPGGSGVGLHLLRGGWEVGGGDGGEDEPP